MNQTFFFLSNTDAISKENFPCIHLYKDNEKNNNNKQDMFMKHKPVPSEGHGHRSIYFFCMSGKPLSQGTYMTNMKSLSETVKKLWPMLIFSLKKVTGKGQGHRSKSYTVQPRYNASRYNANSLITRWRLGSQNFIQLLQYLTHRISEIWLC